MAQQWTDWGRSNAKQFGTKVDSAIWSQSYFKLWGVDSEASKLTEKKVPSRIKLSLDMYSEGVAFRPLRSYYKNAEAACTVNDCSKLYLLVKPRNRLFSSDLVAGGEKIVDSLGPNYSETIFMIAAGKMKGADKSQKISVNRWTVGLDLEPATGIN